MILQNIVWPELAEQPERELYYHGTPEHTEDGNLLIKDGESICFDTYFNCFCGRVWKESTTVTECEFQLVLSGTGTVFLKDDSGAIHGTVSFQGNVNVKLPLKQIEEKLYYLELNAELDTVLSSGRIVTERTGREVHLALVTCTYNRQKDLYQNLALLKKKNKIPADGVRVLDHIYVVDNARNLPKEELEDETTTVLPNPNTGGAGGFTRGMKEAMQDSSMTHVLLMDDDVKIEFEAIARTKSLLSLIKEEFQENFIGGAMIRKEHPCIVHASGEVWKDGTIINPHCDTDVRTLEQVKRLLEPVNLPRQYNAWWYCCIPRSQMETRGYPLPFFIHGDDIEYGLRNGRTPVFLNGIAVWHESFEHKRSSMLQYYEVRNWLIINAIYKKKGALAKAVRIFGKCALASILRYRYEDVKLAALAVEDFLKGPDWFLNSDPEQLHQKVSAMGYRMQELPEIQEYEELTDIGSRLPNKLRMLAGYLLPARGKVRVSVGAPAGCYAGKKEVLLVDPASGKGFAVRKSFRETIQCVGRLMKQSADLLCHYSETEKKWKQASPPKKEVYVVSTYYHALIACVKQLNHRKTADIIVTAYIPEGRQLAEKIKESGLFCKTIYMDEMTEYTAKNRWDYYLNFHRKNKVMLERQISLRFEEYGQIYIFHDDTWIAHYLKEKRMKYYLMEDALDSFKTISKSPFAYMLPEPGLKGRLKRRLHIGYRFFGLDACVDSIEVNDRSGIELTGRAFGNLVEVPRKKLFDSLQSEDIAKLIEIFAKNLPEIEVANYSLLMTKPLYADRLVASEEEQKRVYAGLVKNNAIDEKMLVIKPHPRDTTDYTTVFPKAVIADKNMPAEMFQYLGYVGFKTVLSIGSEKIKENKEWKMC